MLVAIHQPETWPWPGFFSKIALSDLFVILDNVQFEKNYVQNRNIFTHLNKPDWYTLPVSDFKFGTNINEILLSNNLRELNKLKNKFSSNYPGSEYVLNNVFDFLDMKEEFLVSINLKFITYAVEFLKIRNNLILASNLPVISESKTVKIINIVKTIGGTEYLSGPSGKNYLDESEFKRHGIKLKYFAYKLPRKKQISSRFQYSMFHWMLKEGYNCKSLIENYTIEN